MTRARRTLAMLGATGLLLTAVAAFFALAPGFFPDPEQVLLEATEQVPLEGYTLAVRDYGVGWPAIIIEGGLACSKELYTGLQFDLAKKTRVISYDHAGIGESTPRAAERTLPHYVEELRALLEQKQLKPPYILLGHSLGGHIIRYYAHLHPEEVGGLIFIDHPHEDWFRYIRETWPKEASERYFEWWRPEGSKYEGTALEELLLYEKNGDLVRGIYPRADVPTLMFTGNAEMHYLPAEKERDRKKWAELQASIIANVRDKKHIVDREVGHVPFRQKPELFAREIGEFVDRVRVRLKAR